MQGREETWLVTGAFGCIGAWTTVTLVREGVDVVTFNRGDDDHRLRLIASPEEFDRITSVRGDITDLAALERVLTEHDVTHVVHLAAMQAPFCKADPPLGAQVNVTGTVNVLEAVKRRGLKTPFVYASSSGVYDARGEEFAPTTIYGVYKIANEGCARLYWQEDGVASIGLRPLVAYGPGRDRGMTASPTQAMASAAKGEPFRIPFGGRMQFQYAPDVARAFVDAGRRPPAGAESFNLGGPIVSMEQIVAAIKEVVPDTEITFDDIRLPFPEELSEPLFEMPSTPLEQGTRETIEVYRRA